jgi:phenylacetate-CoA ligase
MGGSKIKPADDTEPPFWVINKPDNQLQVSPYHLTEDSFPYYRDKLNTFAPIYLSGYAHALYNLALLYRKHGGRTYTPKAIFLDSEGVPPKYKNIIENIFDAPTVENYGLGEVGLIAVEYPDHQLRVLDLSVWLEVVDENGNSLPDGESGRLIVTDLAQNAVPIIRYDTGDIGSIVRGENKGEWSGTILKSIVGRSDDIIVTPKGRRIGRLSHVTKPGHGIIESQIAHVSPTEIVIRVVPASDFDEKSMVDVVHTAEVLLGTDMKVTWKTVDKIPRTNRHKFKHVVREF